MKPQRATTWVLMLSGRERYNQGGRRRRKGVKQIRSCTMAPERVIIIFNAYSYFCGNRWWL
jgi:hypothetical protein